ncbi:MAG TPA: M14 family zinc carboxypeptidase [Gaiellaceae bacterium]|nr:M14 family zinc carboxypeptidase [Gaiellaceae bacterium]
MRFLALLALSLLLAGAAASSAGVRRVVLGRSLQGRPIVAYELGDPSSARKVLVVGCIHGNECAGIAILDRLRRLGPLAGIDLWLAQDANPDGHAAEIRGNAHGVDLNRNFPWRWRSLGGVNHAGAGPGSERETRIAMSLILRLRPQITIWFHQHLNMVVLTAGNLGLQRRFARLAGLRAGRLPRYPGTATGWSNATISGTTAFVVELPAGRLSPRAVIRLARAVREVAR